MWLIAVALFVGIAGYIIVTTIIDIMLMGKLIPRISMKCRQKEYIVKNQNRIDIQTGYQCSAFSVAYLLRHFGIDANGIDIYNQMPYKMKDGCVYPKGLPKVLQEYGVCTKYYSGNIEALQNEVCKGMPVIVMIRVRIDKNWLHYVPVVGFDDRYVFVAESLPELVNCNCNKCYNRRIEKKYFLQLWNTAMLKQPLFRNTFYVVTKSNTKKGE